MDKQGKGGSNAVDEEQKAASVRNGTAECAFDAPAARRMCTRPAKGTKRKHERESKCPNNAAQPATRQ